MSETSSASAWRCAARRPRPPTPSSVRAGPRRATRPRLSTRRAGAWGTCWPKGRSRSRSARTTSTTTPSPSWRSWPASGVRNRSGIAVRSAAEWRAVLAEVDQAGLCAHPVRLRGLTLDRSSGELVEGGLLVAVQGPAGRRVPVVLPPLPGRRLAARGRRHPGRQGRQPPSVVGHPQLFVTLTAPSFGPVHRGRCLGRCDPGRVGLGGACEVCPHGALLSCTLRHGERDPAVGEPLCPECFDYRGAVLWNAHVSRAVGPDLASPLPRGRPGGGAEHQGAALGGPALLHQGGRVPGPRARPPPRGAPRRRRGRAERARRRPGSTSALLTEAIGSGRRRSRRAGPPTRGYGTAPGPLGRPTRCPGARRR